MDTQEEPQEDSVVTLNWETGEFDDPEIQAMADELFGMLEQMDESNDD